MNMKPGLIIRQIFTRMTRTGVLSLILALFAKPSVAADPRVPDLLKEVGIDQHLGDQLPLKLPFVDDTGRAVDFGTYFGNKPVILALVYYQCPMLCNLVLDGLLRSLNSISLKSGQDFQLVAVSINPKETPELAAAKRANYLKGYNQPDGAAGWHFLTGTPGSIEALTRAVGFRYAYLPEKDQFAHASGIMVITPGGKISRYFFGIEYSPRDLRLGLVESSANGIGSMIDQLLLFCYHYDPADGKYSFMILRFIQTAGIMTVLLMGGTIALLLRRERRGLKHAAVRTVAVLETIPQEKGIGLK